jgi:hypothetical protein
MTITLPKIWRGNDQTLMRFDDGLVEHDNVMRVLGCPREPDGAEFLNEGVYHWLNYVAHYPDVMFGSESEPWMGFRLRTGIRITEGRYNRMEHASEFLQHIADEPYILSVRREHESFVVITRAGWQMLHDCVEQREPDSLMPLHVADWLKGIRGDKVPSDALGVTYGFGVYGYKCGYSLDTVFRYHLRADRHP